MEIVEVNGVKYRQKEQKQKPVSRTAAPLFAMMGFGGMFADYGQTKREKETPNVDLVKEYELIQQKKSNLSRNQRDWVVWKFNRKFEKIDENNDNS